MFDQKDEILSFFRANEHLLEKPYQLFEKKVRVKYITRRANPAKNITEISYTDWEPRPFAKSSCEDNDIYKMLCRIGCGPENVYALSSFKDWGEVVWHETLNAEREKLGYPLIDLSLYLVHLLNIYLPNQGLIANLYATNVLTDAVGRENQTAALKAVSKVIARTLGQSKDFLGGEKMAEDILHLLRRQSAKARPKAIANGIDYERQCDALLRAGGFEVQSTPATGDYGADLIAYKDDLGYVVQCKDTSKPVGVKAVQEVIGARRHYGADFAAVCCSAGFTDAAVELATSNKVILCNATQLVKRLDGV